MASGSSIGMMDSAFFVPKGAILEWLNTTYKLHLTKIEETASGAVACQILDSIYHGEVPMSKVRWDSKSSHEWVGNYKIVQQVLQKKGCDKYIDVEKLIRGKYQDNLEMMQWFKKFWELNANPETPYDPLARRAKGKGADAMPAFTTAGGGGEGGGAGEEARAGAAAAPRAVGRAAAAATGAGAVSAGSGGAVTAGGGAASRGGAATGMAKPGAAAAARSSPPKAAGAVASGGHHAPAAVGAVSGTAQQQLAALRRQCAEAEAQAGELRDTCVSLERERDFYFSKLRDIEILMQTYTGPDKGVVEAVFKVMYATDEDFAAPPGAEGEGQTAAGTASASPPAAAAAAGGQHSDGVGSPGLAEPASPAPPEPANMRV